MPKVSSFISGKQSADLRKSKQDCEHCYKQYKSWRLSVIVNTEFMSHFSCSLSHALSKHISNF